MNPPEHTAPLDGPRLVDKRGRVVSYLRMSVTDRCNLHCFYCRVKNAPHLRHKDILRYEEMTQLAVLAERMKITKLRLTGGEPFLRPGFPLFLEMLTQAVPRMDIRITTNGLLLADMAGRLAALGVKRVNVSLDSLDAENFRRITGHDGLSRVLEAIGESLAQGLQVKINVVAIRGVNDRELPAFLNLAMTRPVEVRFIEFMPLGRGTTWNRETFWPAGEIVAGLRNLARLDPLPRVGKDCGPARLFRPVSAQGPGLGRLGIISPISEHFCASCNRLRVTSDGRLRTCLFSDKEYRLKPLLRSPKLGPEAVLKVMRLAVARKPLGYELLAERLGGAVCAKAMTAIGG